MIAVKDILCKQWNRYWDYVKQFATKDAYTNDEEYNYGRHAIINDLRIDISDPAVQYYCMCNNLELRDIPGGIDNIFNFVLSR